MIEEQIKRIFKELQSDVENALEKASKDTAKEGVSKVKSSSPKRTGQYAAGWGQSKRNDSIFIHNKKQPGLAHLLENGHAKRNGGRTKPKEHIKPVEEWAIKELERRIEKELS